jgi:hypothetical protein
MNVLKKKNLNIEVVLGNSWERRDSIIIEKAKLSILLMLLSADFKKYQDWKLPCFLFLF